MNGFEQSTLLDTHCIPTMTIQDALGQAEAIVDHAAIVTDLFQKVRDKTNDGEWDKLVDGPLGELLDALCDLEEEVESV